jgi:hypothetical protein
VSAACGQGRPGPRGAAGRARQGGVRAGRGVAPSRRIPQARQARRRSNRALNLENGRSLQFTKERKHVRIGSKCRGVRGGNARGARRGRNAPEISVIREGRASWGMKCHQRARALARAPPTHPPAPPTARRIPFTTRWGQRGAGRTWLQCRAPN